MTDTFDARDFQARLQRLEAMLHDVEHSADPATRQRTRAIVQTLLDLHLVGLQRLTGHLERAGDVGCDIMTACAEDDAVAGLLLLHGLHPRSTEDRIRAALEQVRPYLRTHGGDVELVELRDGVVHLRLHGSCHGCPSSAVTMKQTIEEAIYARAPEVAVIEVDEAVECVSETDGTARVALPVLQTI